MNTKKRLLDQEKALDSFFEALLRDVEAYAEQESDSAPLVPINFAIIHAIPLTTICIKPK